MAEEKTPRGRNEIIKSGTGLPVCHKANCDSRGPPKEGQGAGTGLRTLSKETTGPHCLMSAKRSLKARPRFGGWKTGILEGGHPVPPTLTKAKSATGGGTSPWFNHCRLGWPPSSETPRKSDPDSGVPTIRGVYRGSTTRSHRVGGQAPRAYGEGARASPGGWRQEGCLRGGR